MSAQNQNQQLDMSEGPGGLVPAPTAAAAYDLTPHSLQEALEIAKYLSESDFVPKDYIKKPGNILVAMQWGQEIGLKTMQALQNISAINGRPALWGDSLLALVRAGVVELLGEGLSVSVESGRFVARSQVVGREHRVRTFVETRMSKGHVDVTDDPLLRSLLDSGRARLHARTGPDGAEVRTRSLDVTAEDFHLVDASGRPDPRIIAIGIPAGDVQPGSAIGATPGVPSPLIAGADIAAAQLLTLARETVPVG